MVELIVIILLTLLEGFFVAGEIALVSIRRSREEQLVDEGRPGARRVRPMMIKHHQGALDMVAKLFDTPGSGQQPELFSFATDVDAGQRAEIGRMHAILKTLTPSPTQ